jgi:hypothetical protein
MASRGSRGTSPARLADVALITRSKGPWASSSAPPSSGPAAAESAAAEPTAAKSAASASARAAFRLTISKPAWPRRQQRLERAARRAAGADQQYPAAREVEAEVVAQVAQQACAVGVVAEEPRRLYRQGVHRARPPGPRREARGRGEGRELVRHSDVETLAALGQERRQRRVEAARWHLAGLVAQRLAGELGKARMDPGRTAVPDRVAEHRVSVGGAQGPGSLTRPSASAPPPARSR